MSKWMIMVVHGSSWPSYFCLVAWTRINKQNTGRQGGTGRPNQPSAKTPYIGVVYVGEYREAGREMDGKYRCLILSHSTQSFL